jgi:nucleolar protein 12
MSLPENSIKLSKRKLRFDRCKSSTRMKALKSLSNTSKLSDTSKSSPSQQPRNREKLQTSKDRSDSHPSTSKPSQRPLKQQFPRPTSSKPSLSATKSANKPPAPSAHSRALAEKLSTLSKEDRKAIKSADEIRVARRLEKKKLKLAIKKDDERFGKKILGKKDKDVKRSKDTKGKKGIKTKKK